MPGGAGEAPLEKCFGEDRVVVHFTILLAIEVQAIMQYVHRLAIFPAISRRRNSLTTFVSPNSFPLPESCSANQISKHHKKSDCIMHLKVTALLIPLRLCISDKIADLHGMQEEITKFLSVLPAKGHTPMQRMRGRP